MSTRHDNPGIAEALKSAGSAAGLARALGVTRQAIHKWQRIPAERVRDVERVTGVPRETLRPDLYEAAQ
jgi:DNA-binding transcriptional regulator YdaS (Cro superfamily)